MRILGYSPALNGIRGYAVILVMLSHSNFQWFKNGTLGVSAFFALSGFLITKLILEEFDARGRFSIKAFYCRRAFRILPTLYVVLGATLAYALFFNPTMLGTVVDEIVSAGLFVYNIAWAWGVKSFMLYHSWSLALEEQFYLVWPLLLGVLLKIKNRKIAYGIFVVVLALSLGVPFLTAHSGLGGIVRALVCPPIFLGCFYALLLHQNVLKFRISEIWIYLILLFMAIFSVHPFRFLGMDESFALLTLCLIHYLIHAGSGPVRFLFTNQSIQFVGKISYGLYLWHLPIFKAFAFNPIAYGFIYKFLVAFAVAAVSWFFFEKPLIAIGHAWSKKLIEKAT